MSPKQRWDTYLDYLQMKIQERDWRGARDACADLEVLEAEHPHLKPNPLLKVTSC